MRIWRAERFGKPTEVLELHELALADPEPGVVEVKVDAAGVGLPDALMVAGNYPAVHQPPVTPGQEIAGTVVRSGADCTLRPGDRVLSSTRFAEGFGGFSEYCQVFESETLPIPPGMNAEAAAGFWVPYHTGYVGIIQRGQLQPSETLLVLGGAGSCGSAAIQLGKAVGAEVIATVSSTEKAEFCESLGADHVINYRETPIHEAIRELKGRAGVEMIYDPVGGTAYAQAVKCIARHGRVILIGYSSGEWPKIDPLNAILRSYSLVGAYPGARTQSETRAQHAILCDMTEAGKIRVPIDQVFDFEQAPEAIARVGHSEAVGKVIVRGTGC